MGRVRTMQILSLCVVLLLAIYPMGISAQQEVNLSIETDFEAEEWYVSGDSINFNSWLMNSGDSISFDDDPTCGIVVNIYDSKAISFKMVKKFAEVKFVDKHLILAKPVNHTPHFGTLKSTNNWLKAEYTQ